MVPLDGRGFESLNQDNSGKGACLPEVKGGHAALGTRRPKLDCLKRSG